jgi:hypothetical protein
MSAIVNRILGGGLSKERREEVKQVIMNKYY